MPGGEIWEGLNASQRAAVEHGDGPLLVIAGAGTGKTRALTARICWLLEKHPEISGENILALTYTDKAANEMLWRVKNAAGERAEGISLGTFHSFCLEKILGIANPELQPLEDHDHWILLRRNIAECGLKHYSKLADPGKYLSDFREFFSRCQDELIAAEEYVRFVASARMRLDATKAALPDDERQAAEEGVERLEEIARTYRISDRLLRERNFATWGEQIMHSVNLLRSNPEMLASLRERYRFILVDEFQDTNFAQLELLWLLAGDSRNIFAVGDDDQAIYRFRGASFGSFTIFLNRFAYSEGGGKPVQPAIVSLTENYRSSQRILRAAHQVIQFNEKSPLLPAKNLTTTRPPGEKIRIAEFNGAPAEGEWAASEIERLRGANGDWSQFAVLYRSHRHREQLVRALRRRKIPFRVHGLSALSNTLIRDVLSWLRAVAHPGDDVAFARVLAVPRWRFVPSDLLRLVQRSKGKTLLETLGAEQRQLPFTAGDRQSDELLALLQSLQEFSRHATARQVFDEMMSRLEVATLVSDADRICLDFFARFITEWEKKSDATGLRAFLEYFGYYLQAGGDLSPDEGLTTGDAVQLMTVHGAKGLEFDQVFVIHLSRSSFPPNNRKAVIEFPTELMKDKKPEGDFRIQEERRLFYVAITRARKRLTLTTIINPHIKPSTFLEDLLRDAGLKSRDIEQISPAVSVPAEEETAAPVPADASHPGLFTSVSPDSRVYSQIALWSRAYHPPLPEPLHLSASAIDVYRQCPQKYLYNYVWGIRGKAAPAMVFGNVMHSAVREMMQAWMKRQKLSRDDVALILERKWKSEGYEDAYQEEEYRRAGLAQLLEFRSTHNPAAAPIVLHTEKKFELPMGDDVIVTGRIDQINQLPDGTVEVVDYKTGSPKQPKDAKDSVQLSIYALAVRELLELEPSRLMFYNLTSNNAVETTCDEKSLARARCEVADVAAHLRAAVFPATVNYLCSSCDYRILCPAHEDLATIRPAQPARA